MLALLLCPLLGTAAVGGVAASGPACPREEAGVVTVAPCAVTVTVSRALLRRLLMSSTRDARMLSSVDAMSCCSWSWSRTSRPTVCGTVGEEEEEKEEDNSSSRPPEAPAAAAAEGEAGGRGEEGGCGWSRGEEEDAVAPAVGGSACGGKASFVMASDSPANNDDDDDDGAGDCSGAAEEGCVWCELMGRESLTESEAAVAA